MLWETYNDGQLSVQSYFLSALLRHIGVIVAQTDLEVVTEDPYLQLD